MSNYFSIYINSPSLLLYQQKSELLDNVDKKDINLTETPAIESNPSDKEVLRSMFPPRITQEMGKKFIQYVSSEKASRDQARDLFKALDDKIRERQAREKGICPVREDLYSQCFDEIIRQVTIECPERGLLLNKVKNEINMTIASYQTLYESSISFGIRKQIQEEYGKDDIKKRIMDLEEVKKELLNEKIRLNNSIKLQEKRHKEILEKEISKRQEEELFMKSQNENLDKFLKGVDNKH